MTNSNKAVLPLLGPGDLDSPVRPAARHVTVGDCGRFGWWVGVLSRQERPLWDIWHCNHQHSNATEARECVAGLILALRGESDPIRLRREGRRSA